MAFGYSLHACGWRGRRASCTEQLKITRMRPWRCRSSSIYANFLGMEWTSWVRLRHKHVTLMFVSNSIPVSTVGHCIDNGNFRSQCNKNIAPGPEFLQEMIYDGLSSMRQFLFILEFIFDERMVEFDVNSLENMIHTHESKQWKLLNDNN